MTTRSDVDVEWNASPRVAEVAAPSTEINMQDIVDTLRKQEDTFRGMSEKKLLNASGKEDLGGGVKVGITVALQNLLLAFAGRTTPAEEGTVTSVPVAPVAGTQRFVDSSATFITNNVQRGSLVINFDDRSVADVIEVVSETELVTKTLAAGISNVYTVNDNYKVWNIVQVNAQGGNLVAVDDLQASISPILPTAFTQVILTSSSSATLQEQEDIQFASFNGGVTLDPTNGTPGVTAYPAGTARQPTTTLSQALTIATARGFDKIFVRGTYTFDAADSVDGFIFEGSSPEKDTLVLTGAANIQNCILRKLTINGALDGGNAVNGCIIAGLNYIDGTIIDCFLAAGDIVLSGTQANILRCGDAVAGATAGDTAVIDMGGGGTDLIVSDYHGDLLLKNMSSSADVTIEMSSGQLILDSTITAGNITVRGVGKLVDNSVGATVAVEILDGSQFQVLRKLMQNRMETNPTTGVMTIYDDDDTTVLLQGNIYEDVLATQIYRGRGMERRNRLT